MKLAKILTFVFGILTICGASYVLYTGGKANAGYAVIPMLFYFTCYKWYCKKNK